MMNIYLASFIATLYFIGKWTATNLSSTMATEREQSCHCLRKDQTKETGELQGRRLPVKNTDAVIEMLISG